MRTAQKNRPTKQVPTSKSGGPSFGSPSGSGDELFNQSSLGSWISPPGMEHFPADESPFPNERRSYPRANLRLPFRVVRVAGSVVGSTLLKTRRFLSQLPEGQADLLVCLAQTKRFRLRGRAPYWCRSHSKPRPGPKGAYQETRDSQ